MAEVHVWTALKWQCPMCPKLFVLCSSPDHLVSHTISELTYRGQDHLIEQHHMMMQSMLFGEVSHVVVTPPVVLVDQTRPNLIDFDFARAVLGQVMEWPS
jgi:hypothetical protein